MEAPRFVLRNGAGSLAEIRTRPFVPIEGTPPLISFFTGGGFLDLGFARAGFPVIWSLEVLEPFCDAHDHGMQTLYANQGITGKAPTISCREDIRKKGPSAIRREALGTLTRGDYFGIVGGPPCPDFSVGGKNKGFSGDRGQLTQVFIERICELEPSFFVIENVKGLISTRAHREFLVNELWKLEEKGYAVDLKVLNALDLGVPQDRERVFIVGVRRDLIRKLYCVRLEKQCRGWFPWPEDPRFKNAKSRFPWPSTSPFGADPPMPDGVPQELCLAPLILDIKATASLPNGQEYFTPYSPKFTIIAEGDDSRKSFKRLHRFRYSPTAAYGNNEVHLHPTQPRRLTVREAMRIQTVPDGYALPAEMPLSLKFKLIGNGVPIQLAAAVGHSLRQFLLGQGTVFQSDPEETNSSAPSQNQPPARP
ncbi:MAG: DNA cytosine methyltransferase [Kiritimatiellae bacterium]|nr:DNA cytosine methyltransferase [Kiritimatiellia bacterium]